MPEEIKRILEDRKTLYREMRKEIPEAMEAWTHMQRASMCEGSVSVKNKELIALGMAIVQRCKFCIVSHIKNALNAGATRAEICEVFGVAIEMGGGPAGAYSRFALKALNELDSAGKGDG